MQGKLCTTQYAALLSYKAVKRPDELQVNMSHSAQHGNLLQLQAVYGVSHPMSEAHGASQTVLDHEQPILLAM